MARNFDSLKVLLCVLLALGGFGCAFPRVYNVSASPSSDQKLRFKMKTMVTQTVFFKEGGRPIESGSVIGEVEVINRSQRDIVVSIPWSPDKLHVSERSVLIPVGDRRVVYTGAFTPFLVAGENDVMRPVEYEIVLNIASNPYAKKITIAVVVPVDVL